MSRKKRTKTKSKKSAVENKAKKQEEIVEKEEVDLSEETDKDELEDEEDDGEELQDNEDTSADTNALLLKAQDHFEQGNYRAAQEQLVSMLESSPSPEEAEQAQTLLSRMDIDVRTLMVGAVAMLTILLIPTVGFLQALWTVPVLFLILLLDPRLFRSPENAD